MRNLLCILVLMVALSSIVFADNLKIGVLDLQKVLQSAAQVKAADTAFRKEFQSREERIKLATQKLQTDIDQLKLNTVRLTDAQKTAASDKIDKERSQLQIMQAQFQQDIQDAQTKAMQNILQQIKTTVNNIVARDNYDLILQSSEVVYHRPTLDITQQVIAGLKYHGK
jgi:outer membrane protein